MLSSIAFLKCELIDEPFKSLAIVFANMMSSRPEEPRRARSVASRRGAPKRSSSGKRRTHVPSRADRLQATRRLYETPPDEAEEQRELLEEVTTFGFTVGDGIGGAGGELESGGLSGGLGGVGLGGFEGGGGESGGVEGGDAGGGDGGAGSGAGGLGGSDGGDRGGGDGGAESGASGERARVWSKPLLDRDVIG